MPTFRPLDAEDRTWVRQWMIDNWGGDSMISCGKVFYPAELPGFVALNDDDQEAVVGLITYRVEGDECEIGSLDSLVEGQGIGTALLELVQNAAREQGCQRLFLITTNDNLNALRFYQKRGYRLGAVRPGAVDEARAIKPGIPLLGENDIPIRDELELELILE